MEYDILEKLLAGILKVEPEEIQDDWKIGVSPNWDSFAQMDIILMLEEEFRLHIDSSNFDSSTSVMAIKTLLTANSQDNSLDD